MTSNTPGEVLLWIAVAAWLVVGAGALWAYTHPGYSSVSGADAKPGTASETDVTSTTRR